jgi:hypothetical protein
MMASAVTASRRGAVAEMEKVAIELAETLARLSNLTIFELRGEWRRLHRMLPPMRLSRDLLMRAITYKLQETPLGGLSKSILRKLERLSLDSEASDAHKPAPAQAAPSRALRMKMRKPDRPKASQIFRCAIYTRKSSDDGLEQEFNSLDAQREACEAYVISQKHAGWIALPDMYDDGGCRAARWSGRRFSGSSPTSKLARPRSSSSIRSTG